MSNPDPRDFETPVFEVWARNASPRGPGDDGEDLSLKVKTVNLHEARDHYETFSKYPYQAQVRVTWVLDKVAYGKACDLAQLAKLKAQYPEGS